MFLLLGAGSQLVAQSFLDDYFARVARNQAEQPHWGTPVATVTPRLEQEFRYDIFWQGTPTAQLPRTTAAVKDWN